MVVTIIERQLPSTVTTMYRFYHSSYCLSQPYNSYSGYLKPLETTSFQWENYTFPDSCVGAEKRHRVVKTVTFISHQQWPNLCVHTFWESSSTIQWNVVKQEGSQAGRGDSVGQQWTAWVSEWIQPQKWASGVLVTTVGACPKNYRDVPTMWSAYKGTCYWVQYCVWRPQPNMWLVFCTSAMAQLELILSLS